MIRLNSWIAVEATCLEKESDRRGRFIHQAALREMADQVFDVANCSVVSHGSGRPPGIGAEV